MLKLVTRNLPIWPWKSIAYSEMNPVGASGVHCEVKSHGLFSTDTDSLVVKHPYLVATRLFGWRPDVPAEAAAILRFMKVFAACGAKPERYQLVHDWATRCARPVFSFLLDASSSCNRAYYTLWPVPSTPSGGKLFGCQLIYNTVSYQRMDPTIMMNFVLIDQALHACLVLSGVPELSTAL